MLATAIIIILMVLGGIGLVSTISMGICYLMHDKKYKSELVLWIVGIVLFTGSIISWAVLDPTFKTYNHDKYDLAQIEADVPVITKVDKEHFIYYGERIEYTRVGPIEEYVHYVSPTPTPVVIDHPEWLRNED
jgi:hypothetical protein